MPLGYLAIVLHAHLPFIRHPEYTDFLEEDWLFEAITETYAPLLSRFETMRSDGVSFRLTMTVTPPLAAMLNDHYLQSRFHQYIDRRVEILEQEILNNRGSHLEFVARHYCDEYKAVRDFVFKKHKGQILKSFRSLQDSGHLELITCTATHGFLPLIKDLDALRQQILSAVESHETHFGRRPRGIWLAECGYDHRVDALLAEAGLEYFFVDSHGILFGDPQPVYGVYAPVITEAGVNVFARDPESSKQVWSQKEGYPGDYNYREFYRDLGYDADLDYLRPYLHSDGQRRALGIKYHRITGDVELGSKQFYDPVKATEKAAEHAGNFLFNRQAQARYLRDKTHYPPIIVSPYDAELFGHWWYEGPQFLEFLIRKAYYDQHEIELITCADYLDRHSLRQIQKPNPSTWGSEGHNLVWLNGGNAWLYRHQHWAEEKFKNINERYSHSQGDSRRAVNQLKRELLLLQSSDWAFILTTGTTVSYANKRFREHLQRFQKLAHQLEDNQLDLAYLTNLEAQSPIFSSVHS